MGPFQRPARAALRHPAPECAGTECDRFLEVTIAPGAVSVQARLIDALPGDVTMDTVRWERLR